MLAVARDMAGRPISEMSGEDRRTVFSRLLQEPTAGSSCVLRMFAKRAVPIRTEDLQRLMHDIATEYASLPAIDELNRNVADAVPGRRMERQTVADRSLAIHDLGLRAFDDRKNAVFVDAGRGLAAR
jgi:hypothetical protein